MLRALRWAVLVLVVLVGGSAAFRSEGCSRPHFEILKNRVSGMLESPFYPGYYGRDRKYCTTIIDIEQFKEEIELKFLDIQLKPGHHLYIYERLMDSSAENLTENTDLITDTPKIDSVSWVLRLSWSNFDGEPNNPTYSYVFTNDIRVQFYHDGNGQEWRGGYQAWYRIIPADNPTPFVHPDDLLGAFMLHDKYYNFQEKTFSDLGPHNLVGTIGSHMTQAAGPMYHDPHSRRSPQLGPPFCSQRNSLRFVSNPNSDSWLKVGMDAADNAKLKIDNSWTASTYFYYDSLVSGNGRIFEYETSGAPPVRLEILSSTSFLIVYGPTNQYVTVPNTNVFPAGQWHWISFSYDAVAGRCVFYKDSIVLYNVACTAGLSNGAASDKGLWIGTTGVPNNWQHGLSMNCLTIYKRVLTHAERIQLRNTCMKLNYPNSNVDAAVPPVMTGTCDFDDASWCNWTPSTGLNNDKIGLRMDTVYHGAWKYGYTGPDGGMSSELIYDRDFYMSVHWPGAYRWNRATSPLLQPGRKCFSMWYQMHGLYTHHLQVGYSAKGAEGQELLWQRYGYQGRQWRLLAMNLILTEPREIYIAIQTGNHQYSEIAVDNIKITDGYCGDKATKCPDGWVEHEFVCFLPVLHRVSNFDQGRRMCEAIGGDMYVAEDKNEDLAFRHWLRENLNGPNLPYAYWYFFIGARYSGGKWLDSNERILMDGTSHANMRYYIGWKKPACGTEPSGSESYVWFYRDFNQATCTNNMEEANLYDANGFSAPASPICRMTKLEASYYSFNCTFDGGHMCGWNNVLYNRHPIHDAHSGSSGSQDFYVWGGSHLYRPGYWYAGSFGRLPGPISDSNQGGYRGKYIRINDRTCGNNQLAAIRSPLVTRTREVMCFSMKIWRSGYDSRFTMIRLVKISSAATYSWPYEIIGNMGNQDLGDYWATWNLDVASEHPFFIEIETQCSSNERANTAFDDIKLTPGACPFQVSG